MKQKKQTTKNMLLFTSIIFNFVLIGACLNGYVMIKNDGLMPVKASFSTPKSNPVDGVHFFYENKSSVNYWLLSDIIHLGKYGTASIGDVLLIIPSLTYILTSIYIVYKNIRFKRHFRASRKVLK